MARRIWGALVLSCAALLSACGGGGGSSAPAGTAATPSQDKGGSGNANAAAGGFTLSRTSVTVGKFAGASGGAQETIDVTAVDDKVAGFAIGYADGVTPPSWLQISTTGQGRSQQLVLTLKPGSLAPGIYKTSVRIASGTAELAVLGHQDVAVIFSVLPNTGTAAATTTSLGFSETAVVKQTVDGAATAFDKTLLVTPKDKRVVALVSGPSPAFPASNWLGASTTRTADGWSVKFNATLAGLKPGKYSTGMRVVAIDLDGAAVGVQDVPVTVEVLSRLYVSSSAASLAGVSGAPQPAHVNVVVIGQGLSWHASTSAGLPVGLSATSGTSDTSLDLQIDLSKAVPGDSAVVVSITSDDGQQSSVSIPVHVDAPVLSVSSPQLNLSAVNGSDIGAMLETVSLSNGANPELTVVADAPWLVVSRTGNKLSNGFAIKADPAAASLASGTYTGTVRISVATGPQVVSKEIGVRLVLTPPVLNVSAQPLQFGGDLGRDLSGKTFSVWLSNNLVAPVWRVVSAPSWLTLTKTSGSFGADAVISAGLALSKLKPGQTADNLVLGTKVNGDTVTATVPVQARLDQHKLVPSEVGVAFVQASTWSRLSRQITVRDNMGQDTPWTATSSQGWLKVTASGKAGDKLTLTADPAGLPLDQLQTATVTLASTDASVATIEKIQVGLWAGSATPGAVVSLSRTIASDFVLDPVRPYMYTTTPQSKDVVVYNLYTGSETARMSNVLSNGGGAGLIAPDGSRLYIQDGSTVAVIDLQARTKLASWPITLTAGFSLMGRPNGKPMILAAGLAYDADSGSQLSGVALPTDLAYAIGPDLTTVYGINQGLSPSTLYKGRLDYSVGRSNAVSYSQLDSRWDVGSNGQDVAISPDGKVVATASGAPYQFPRFDANSLAPLSALAGEAYPGNVEYGSDGRLFAGSFNWYDSKDLWVYNADGSLHSSYLVRGYAREMFGRALKVSGDAFFAVITTTENLLKILPVGP